MKNTLFLTALMLTSFVFGQKMKPHNQKAQKQKHQIEQQLVNQWSAYSKAYEYSDYKAIAAHFTFPTTIDLTGSPLIIEDEAALMAWYKEGRTSIQEGYQYSLLEKSHLIWLSKSLVILDATYGRFNAAYERIYTGRGLYMYKKTALGWKMFSVTGIPLKSKEK